MTLFDDDRTMVEERNAMLLPRKTRYLRAEHLHFLFLPIDVYRCRNSKLVQWSVDL